MTFEQLASEIVARPPGLGRLRLVAVDGPGGAGKSVFAERLARALGDAAIVQTDDFASPDNPTDWWPKLEHDVLEPLKKGRPARFERSRWTLDQPAERREVAPAEVLILEGVTSGRRAAVHRLSYTIWLDTSPEERLRRGLRRDGETHQPEWLDWMAREEAFYADDPVRERADLIVDGNPTAEHDPEREFVRLD